jgi:hypothetical protein
VVEYCAQSETAMVAWMRRTDAGRGEVVASSFPVGESRRRVCSCGLEEALRKVVRRFVRSIVWDMLSGVWRKLALVQLSLIDAQRMPPFCTRGRKGW